MIVVFGGVCLVFVSSVGGLGCVVGVNLIVVAGCVLICDCRSSMSFVWFCWMALLDFSWATSSSRMSVSG